MTSTGEKPLPLEWYKFEQDLENEQSSLAKAFVPVHNTLFNLHPVTHPVAWRAIIAYALLAEFFIEALLRLQLHPGALVLNKVLPAYFQDPGATRVAERLRADGPALAAELGPDAGDPAAVARVLREVGESS